MVTETCNIQRSRLYHGHRNMYSPAAIILHLLLNNESMSEGKQVISQNINIGSRRHPCEICLLDFLNHRLTRISS